MRSKRICAELRRMREDDPAAWGTDPEMERGYALGGRVELLFPDNYPFSPPKMVRGPTARGAMGMEGAFKWACVRARRKSNLCFFGDPKHMPVLRLPLLRLEPFQKSDRRGGVRDVLGGLQGPRSLLFCENWDK